MSNYKKSFFITDLYSVIPWSKICANSEIDKQVTKSEIKAIFLIYMAYRAIDYCERGAQRDATILIDNIEENLNLLWKNKKTVEQREQQKEKILTKYNWSIDNQKKKVFSNDKFITKLSGINWKLFRRLFEKHGKYVKTETLEKCWDNKPNYEHYLSDTISKVRNSLKKELEKQNIEIISDIIEGKTEGKSRKITAYKLQL